ncbi:MAG: hypothetical protein RLZ50_392 [Bacteroidota bacterium]|jgi:hypothetical protein
MKKLIVLFCFVIFITALFAIPFLTPIKPVVLKTLSTDLNQDKESGASLAKLYCASCHLFPSPSLLDQTTWKNKVLPNMAWRLGIRAGYASPYHDMDSSEVRLVKVANIYPNNPIISITQWKKIFNYYIINAPKDPKSIKFLPLIQKRASQFIAQPIFIEDKELPKTTMVKFDSIHSLLYIGDARGELYALNSRLKLDHKWVYPSAPVDMHFQSSNSEVLCIGSVAPTEKKEGVLFTLDSSIILSTLARPVSMEYADLNADGKLDLIICEFGNHTGKLTWYDGGDRLKENILLSRPGARKLEIVDLNKDGKLDLIVLMAQAQEGIYYFENLGKNKFKESVLINFPPVYGLSYFELVDFNKDGFLDILLTNGDNWDLSRVKKNFHGVRIFMNNGRNQFTQTFFFPLYGTSKALARDFDDDGDLDIAAISFYDELEKPEEGFVYLKNMGNNYFEAFSTPAAANGKWLTMEVGDIDKDGDIDIILGSFIYSIAEMMGLINKGVEHFPQLLLLTNIKK